MTYLYRNALINESEIGLCCEHVAACLCRHELGVGAAVVRSLAKDARAGRRRKYRADLRPLLTIVDQVIAAGEGDRVRRPAEKILLGRDVGGRYVDEGIPAGVEEAWEALSAQAQSTNLLGYSGLGGHPGGSWLVEINALDLDDGRRLYTELQSGDVFDPGVHLIAVASQPNDDTDLLVMDGYSASELGQWFQEAVDREWGGDDCDDDEPGEEC